jgi:hypothetical protein
MFREIAGNIVRTARLSEAIRPEFVIPGRGRIFAHTNPES